MKWIILISSLIFLVVGLFDKDSTTRAEFMIISIITSCTVVILIKIDELKK